MSWSTCDFCDVVKADAAALAGPFRVLPPVWQSLGGRRTFFGPVTTVRAPDDNSRVKELVSQSGLARLTDGREVARVLVVDGGVSLAAEVRRALLGGMLARDAAANGWAGVVVQGGVRDMAELAACDLGVLALGLVPLPTERQGRGEVGVPLLIQGRTVQTGDWLYADADGVVVSDRALHEAVFLVS